MLRARRVNLTIARLDPVLLAALGFQPGSSGFWPGGFRFLPGASGCRMYQGRIPWSSGVRARVLWVEPGEGGGVAGIPRLRCIIQQVYLLIQVEYLFNFIYFMRILSYNTIDGVVYIDRKSKNYTVILNSVSHLPKPEPSPWHHAPWHAFASQSDDPLNLGTWVDPLG